MTILPFCLCAIVSSLLFAVAHIASGSFELVSYDVFMIFFLKKMVAKKPFLCYDEIVQKSSHKEGLLEPPAGGYLL